MSDQGAKYAHKGAWKGVAAGALLGGAVGVAIFLGFKAPWVTVFIGRTRCIYRFIGWRDVAYTKVQTGNC